ncbi:MAG: twin-arginine translocation signal domain-containing protein, partial [Rudanella sp.]|nr:twin-arginine translocation signal domain-containing protein [Rudanella sp.]
MENRREFIKKSALAGLGMSFSASSYARIIGADERGRVGLIGFSA